VSEDAERPDDRTSDPDDGPKRDDAPAGGSTRDPAASGAPIRGDEAPSEDEAPREEAPREEAPREEAPRDEAPREEAPRDEAPRDQAPRDQATRDEATSDETPGDEPASDEPTRVGPLSPAEGSASVADAETVAVPAAEPDPSPEREGDGRAGPGSGPAGAEPADAPAGPDPEAADAPAPAPAAAESAGAAAPAPAAPGPRRPERLPTPPRLLAALAAITAAPTALTVLLVLLGVPQATWGRLSGDDRWEPNDRLADARAVGPGVTSGLTCPGGDVDWFRVAVPEGKALVVEVGPAPEGLGETSVHDAEGVLLARSVVDDGGRERLVYGPVAGGECAVRVWGARRGDYSLDVAFEDLASRFEPNDASVEAAPLGVGRHDGIRCGGGADWYRVQVPPHQPLRGRLGTDAAGLRLEVVDASQGAGVGGDGADAGQEVRIPARAATRTVFLRVSGPPAGYDLVLEPDAADAGDVAARLPTRRGEYEPNDTWEQAPRIEPGVYPDLRCDGQDYYALKVPADTTVAVTLAFQHRDGDIELAIQDAQQAVLADSHSSTNVESARVYLPGGGLVYVVASCWNGRDAAYTMTVMTSAGPPGDELGPGRYTATCSGDDVWRIALERGQSLEATCTFDAAVDLDLQLSDAEGTGLAYSSGMTATETVRYTTGRDEEVFLRVTGGRARYDLEVVVGEGAAGTGVTTLGDGATATSVGRGVYAGVVVEETVWYRLDLEAGQRLEAAVTYASGFGEVDLTLMADGSTPIGEGYEARPGRRSAAHVAEADGPVFVRLRGPGLPITCQLTLAVDGETRAVRRRLEPGVYPDEACPDGDVRYVVTVPAGRTLAAEIAFDHDAGDLDLALVDPQGAELTRSDGVTDVERVRWTAPAGADAEVEVRVYNATGSFDLTVELE